MNLFFEIHSDLPREGPGDNESTRRALAMLPDLGPTPRILDIGCGPGMQTLALANCMAQGRLPAPGGSGQIVALDIHPPFLQGLAESMRLSGAEGISLVRMSMFDMGFAPGSFDLVWSEGAIYTLGFEAGLAVSRHLLRPGGCAAFTELTWLKPEPPAEIAAYWGAEYPGMGSIASNRQSILRQGYREVGQFTLPETSWWDPYYTPIEARIGQLRLKYAGDAGVSRQLDDHQREVDHFRRYSSWYGYVFYIVQIL